MSNFINVDPRIIDFRKDELILPDNFFSISDRKILLAAGDGYHDRAGCDLYQYAIYHKRKYGHEHTFNIFCCKYDYNPEGLSQNISYLMDNPKLNIILCLFDIGNASHLEKLLNLFENSINIISTDDLRVHIPMINAYKLLINDGLLLNIDLRNHYHQSLGYNRNDENFKELFKQIGENHERILVKYNRNENFKKRAELNKIKLLDEQEGGYYLKYLKYKNKYLSNK